MSTIKILQYPNPRLRTKGEEVKQFDDDLQKVVDDMFETHYGSENCAALAATQLDLTSPLRITVIDFSVEKDQPLCLINPEIIEQSGEMFEEEGCMSVGGDTRIYEKVKRAAKVKVRAFDRNGKPIEFEAEGFMAKCIQHELDHLNGQIFIDRLSTLRRQRVEQKLLKLKRHLKKKS